jgi:DNA-binding NarL/FixJ family response regulator
MPVRPHLEVMSEQEWTELHSRLELSPRQAQIVRGVLHCKSDKEIARELDITLPTLRTHLARLFRKLDLNDRTELVVHVLVSLRQHWGHRDVRFAKARGVDLRSREAMGS